MPLSAKRTVTPAKRASHSNGFHLASFGRPSQKQLLAKVPWADAKRRSRRRWPQPPFRKIRFCQVHRIRQLRRQRRHTFTHHSVLADAEGPHPLTIQILGILKNFTVWMPLDAKRSATPAKRVWHSNGYHLANFGQASRKQLLAKVPWADARRRERGR